MDFRLDDDLDAVRGLAADVFADLADADALWAALADTGLLGVALPERHGGAGLGLPALCVLLTEQGRTVAPAPLWPTLVAALAVAEHGPADLLTGVAEGTSRITLALEEYDGADPADPACRAVLDGRTWRLHGLKAAVPAPDAGHVLVSAATPDGPRLFAVRAEDGEWEPTDTTSQEPAANLLLDGAPGTPLGPDALTWTLHHAATALAAVQLGVAEGALTLAAAYTGQRTQFGRPLATFQSLQHLLADCYIDIDAMRVTLWQAVTAIADDDAARAVRVAKWWCGQAGLDVVHRVQHVHGGIGVDVDYPAHRFFLWGKQISATLGGPAAALADLGDLLAAEEVRT